MKKLVTLIILCSLWLNVMAQVPQKMSYQAVIRDAGGNLVTNHAVGMKVTIFSSADIIVFIETYSPNPQTNNNGLVTIEIGSGTPILWPFECIGWENGPYYLKVETDPTGGTNYTISATSQLLSVPFALYAETAKDAATKAYVDAMKETIYNELLDAGLNGIVKDVDNNTYKTIKIGTQVWMAENLKTTKYNDSTTIPLVTDNIAWAQLTTPGYCWYNNDKATYGNIYGALYNWYTVNTGKLCPTGWHVPSDAEWTILTTFLGGESVAGGKMKEAGTIHWTSPNTGATNESGFSSLPGGSRVGGGTFYGIGLVGFWWSSSEHSTALAWRRDLGYSGDGVYRYDVDKRNGFGIRCVRDF